MQTTLAAYEFNATLPAKEKLIEQNHAHIEDQERVKVRNQAEIAAQNQELEQLKASIADFKTKYGDALRFEELKQKNAEQEATLREGRRHGKTSRNQFVAKRRKGKRKK